MMSTNQAPFLLSEQIAFPHPKHALAEPDGLLAIGGALTPDWLLTAYANGIFPWFNDDTDIICWWSPGERGVLRPGGMHVSRSLRKRIRNAGFAVTFDKDFAGVIEHCRLTRLRATDSNTNTATGTWITPAMQRAYNELHSLGVAHSVEVWQDSKLVGGLYGLSLGKMFFGESMFALQPDASKIAFFNLQQCLTDWSFTLIDCQMMNPHLQSLGVSPMPRGEFLQLLYANRSAPTLRGSWQAKTMQGCTEAGTTPYA
tara:strand:+ start:18139 stop:18909 length:771 start_codon:yes stop_codon:yes gene_type:complete